MRKTHLLILLLFSIYTSKVAHAQVECKDALYEADKLFESGKIQESINRLEPCLIFQNDLEERIESYHLLALAYQAIGDVEKTNNYIIKLLLLQPDYQKFPNIDPADFTRMVNQFRVSPKLALGLIFGMNITSVSLKKSYSLYPSTQRYLPVFGAQIGLTSKYSINPNWGVLSNISFSRLSINHIIDTVGLLKQDYKEQGKYIMLDIEALRSFKIHNHFSFHIGTGVGVGYLSSANISLESINLETNANSQATSNPTMERNRLQPKLDLLLGIGYALSQGVVSLEVNYNYFFRNTVKSTKRLDNTNFIFSNQYLSDDLQLRPVLINIAYRLPIRWKVQLIKS